MSDIPDWQHLTEVGESWQEVRMYITNKTFQQHVIIIATTSTTSPTQDFGHTALDDFLLIDGSCNYIGGTVFYLYHLYQCIIIFIREVSYTTHPFMEILYHQSRKN